MDALSELLRAVKLSGAMFYVAECSKPWRVLAPSAATLAKYVAANASRVIEFHLVTRGPGYVRVGDETTPFAAGDLLLIPHGDTHEMGNGSDTVLLAPREAMPVSLADGLKGWKIGGGGEETEDHDPPDVPEPGNRPGHAGGAPCGRAQARTTALRPRRVSCRQAEHRLKPP